MQDTGLRNYGTFVLFRVEQTFITAEVRLAGMGYVRVQIDDETHTGIKDIKNHEGGRPDTVKGCVKEAITEYVERYAGD